MGSPVPHRPWLRVVALGGALLALVAYGEVGRAFYGGFALPQGSGMDFLLPEEVSAFTVYIVFGGMAWALLTVALAGTSMMEAAVGAVRVVARRPFLAAIVVAVLLAAACWTVAHVLLRHAVTSDDEHVYRFIGQTLAAGGLVAPSPGTDLAFYREQFVVLTERVRFGKYPIGYPALLALGQALGMETAVVPVTTGLIALGVAWIARRLTAGVGTPVALLLFATSPQVLCTGASLLSQPAAALCLAVAVAALLEWERPPRRAAWLALGGAALGYGVLVRPLPGALFAGAALAHHAWRERRAPLGQRPRQLVLLGGPIVLGIGAVLLVNRLQVGSALTSGYQAFHRTGEGLGGLRDLVGGDLAHVAMSVFAALFRLDVWLFGWPVSLLLLAFARRTGPWALLWWMVAAELVYRLVAPKAGVGGTGPVYVFEAIPLLCVLAAEGAVQLARGPRGLGSGAGGPAAALLVAGTLVGVTLFLPGRLGDLGRMGQAQRALPDLIERRGLHRALVFHEGVVPPWRCNSPALDDDVLFVRFQRPAAGLEDNLEFWRRRYPQRSAWYFGWPPGGEPFLVPLESFVRSEPRPAP